MAETRKLAAILVADVVGYSRLACAYEDRTFARVALLDDVADMDAGAILDASVLRHAGVAFDEAVLHLDRAAHRIDDAARSQRAML